MYTYIGRQPIFDRNRKVAGYELLYRGGNANQAVIQDGDAATRSVLSDAVTVFGISQLTDGKPAYINFTRNLLMDDFAYLADPRQIVVEIPGSISIDETLIDKLQSLRRAGYTLALDDYTESAGRLRLNKALQYFDIICIDFRNITRLQLKNLTRHLSLYRARLLAARLETLEDFSNARSMGFSLFQGYFFEKPTCLRKQTPSLSATSYGRLFNELLRPNVDFEACCEIIEGDVVMTYMFLRQIQTANYYRGNKITEIHHGLVIMGTEELRRWVSLVLLKQNNVSHSDELAKKAYLRGRFLERLMANSNFSTTVDRRGGRGFLLGMFSLLDQVMGISMESLLRDIQLEPELKDALLGRAENEYTAFLQYVILYEMANERLILPDIGLKISPEEVTKEYMQCIADTDAAFQRMGGSSI